MTIPHEDMNDTFVQSFLITLSYEVLTALLWISWPQKTKKCNEKEKFLINKTRKGIVTEENAQEVFPRGKRLEECVLIKCILRVKFQVQPSG